MSMTKQVITGYGLGDPHYAKTSAPAWPPSRSTDDPNSNTYIPPSGECVYVGDPETGSASTGRVEEVDHPKRYNHGRFECIDVIEDLKLNFNLGSCLKYIWRLGEKNDEINELEKARWYLDREISRRKAARGE